tara:strand:- start:66 stop:191 length:126 start_codon:yes stop_codon:yes gene_type:complete
MDPWMKMGCLAGQQDHPFVTFSLGKDLFDRLLHTDLFGGIT